MYCSSWSFGCESFYREKTSNRTKERNCSFECKLDSNSINNTQKFDGSIICSCWLPNPKWYFAACSPEKCVYFFIILPSIHQKLFITNVTECNSLTCKTIYQQKHRKQGLQNVNAPNRCLWSQSNRQRLFVKIILHSTTCMLNFLPNTPDLIMDWSQALVVSCLNWNHSQFLNGKNYMRNSRPNLMQKSAKISKTCVKFHSRINLLFSIGFLLLKF